jgi:MoaA/NifB/PqqE/SkfB family radical SAM enzyme
LERVAPISSTNKIPDASRSPDRHDAAGEPPERSMSRDLRQHAAAAVDVGNDDEWLVEHTSEGVLLRPDSLRKIYVELSGHCNLQCAMCPRSAWAFTSGFMADDCYERLLAGLPLAEPGRVTLAFGGFGEPTLHPRFLDLIALARRDARRIELITNGTTMDRELARALVSLGVAQVTVSIDGGDDESYAAMRGASRRAVLDALAVLREESRRGRTRLLVGVASVATRRNVASLPALLEAARRLEVDFVSISNVVPHTPEMADEVLWERAALVSNARPDSWHPRMTIGRFDFNAVTRSLVEAVWEQLPVVPPPAFDAGTWHNRCRFVREGMVAISWDGRVAPCLSLLYTHTEYIGGRDKLVRAFDVGHVLRTPLRDVWREPGFREFRRRVREFDLSPCLSCGGCAISDTNEADCFGTPFPACSECLWAQGIVLCP